MKQSFTSIVREAARGLVKFRSIDLIDLISIKSYHDAKRVRRAIHEMKKMGEVVRIEPGLYVYEGRKVERKKLDVIWHLVRSYRQFDTDEMERLSGAARCTVLEYLHCLRGLGYIRQVRRGHWQLVNDPGPETPVNTAKCKKLRSLRRVKREGL